MKFWVVAVVTLISGLMVRPQAATAANPPDKTKLLFTEPQAVGHVIHGFELDSGNLKPIFSMQSNFAQFAQTTVVERPNYHGPALHNFVVYGTNHGDQLLIGMGLNISAYTQKKGFAVASYSSRQAIVASSDNEIFVIDTNMNATVLAPAGWLDLTQYGQIRHIQMIGPWTFIVGTEKGDLVVASTSPAGVVGIPKIVSQGQLAKGRIVQIMAGANHAYIKADVGMLTTELDFFDYNYKMISQVYPQVGDFELLEIEAATGDLLVRSDKDYNRVTIAGKIFSEAAGFFNPQLLFQKGLPNNLRQLAGVYQPRFMPAATPRVTAAVNSTTSKQGVFEPIEADDFLKLAKLETKANKMKELNGAVDAKFFAEWVNMTTTLRYYFKRVPAADLKTYGLRFQIDSLMVLTGKNETQVSLSHFIQALSKGAKEDQAERARLKACTAKLTGN